MWKRVIAPTIIVCLIWIAVSFISTYYFEQIVDSQARTLTDLTTIDAAWWMRRDAWAIRTLLSESVNSPSTDFRSELESLEQSFERALSDAERTLSTAPEQAAAKKIRGAFADYKTAMQEILRRNVAAEPLRKAELERINESLAAIRSECREIAAINNTLIRQAKEQNGRIQFSLMIFRFGFLLAGPLIGLLYGLYIARKINRELLRIRIVLHDATGKLGCDVGAVDLAALGDLPVLHRQIQIVCDRVQNVLAELKDVRLRAIQSERLAAVGELAVGIAHEIRNPLTSVKLLIQNAAQRQHGAAFTGTQFEVVMREILRMEEIVQGMLDFAKPAELKRVRHDVHVPLQQALNLMQCRAESKGVAIQLSKAETALEIDGDAAQLQAVFINLILNALEAMSNGGTLTIATGSNESSCWISFADTGPGIPQTLMPHIFEPFVTSKERGTGLGLAISQRIVREHGGTLVAANRAEGGAIFTVTLETRAPASQPITLSKSRTDAISSLQLSHQGV
ncbi:MAG TPA: ATP-binding protein [Planctomycetota bacterium]|nr:ATP-binding protein [Planctomycetota bacterium]